MIIKARPTKWDKHLIRYELGRRGLTLKALAKASGISEGSLRAAFLRPSAKVNSYIAKTIGVPVQEIWPDWFDHDGDLLPAGIRRKLSRQRDTMASHESRNLQSA